MDAPLSPDGPGFVVPDGLVASLENYADRLAAGTARIGRRIRVDPVALLRERVVSTRRRRTGRISCGGATGLLRARDTWVAVSIARDDDVELLPAWLCADPDSLPSAYPLDQADWNLLAAVVARKSAAELDERAALLGLAVGVLPTTPPAAPTGLIPFDELPVRATNLGAAAPRRLADVTVVDLSALWAGPLCGRLLAEAGAEVVKVESTARPDGARRGDPTFFESMNAMKDQRRVELDQDSGIEELRRTILGADVVIESSRPRALAQLGIDAAELTATGPQVWVSITGYGRGGEGANRVAYGDDAAVAGGLVGWDDVGDPVFCADAAADPCTGLVAATAAISALAHGGRWLLDVALTDVAAPPRTPLRQWADRRSLLTATS